MSLFTNKNRNGLLPMNFPPSYRASSCEHAPVFSHGNGFKNINSSFVFQKTKSNPLPQTTTPTKHKKPFNMNVPEFRGAINWRNAFKSKYNASQMVEEIKKYCEKKSILDFSSENFKIQGRFFSNTHAMAEFIIRLYNLPETCSTLIVVTRLHGCSASFENFYVDLLTTLNSNGIVTFSTLPQQSCYTFQMPQFTLQNDDMEELTNENIDYSEIIDTIENGHHFEIQTAAAQLADISAQSEVMKTLLNIPNITNRLLSVCFKSIDVALVRCILVVLINGLISQLRTNVTKELQDMRARWSTTQKLFNLEVEVRSSNEITTRIDQLLNVSA